jgi:NhaP-type Na+/H+ or K+/H+ antiporter
MRGMPLRIIAHYLAFAPPCLRSTPTPAARAPPPGSPRPRRHAGADHPLSVTTIAVAEGLSFGEPFYLALLLAGVAVIAAVGALSHQHEHAFSASVIYLVLGLGAALIVEALGVDWLEPGDDHTLLERLSELALIIALFGTGLKLDRALTLREWSGVGRLLLVAMPLTIGAVALFGSFVMGLGAGAAIMLGACLAPTDPVLAGDIGVGPPGDEEEREPNFSITGEAGLNDGLAIPFLVLGAFVAGEEGSGWVVEWLAADVLYAVGLAFALGAAVGYGLGAVAVRLRDRRLFDPRFDGWLAIAAVLVIYGLTELASADGFVAAFAGGVAFRRYEHGHEYNARVHEGAEVVEKFAELALVLLVGSLVTVQGMEAPGLEGWLLVPVLLAVLRPASVVVALLGSGLRAGERTWIAWFGVRGVGSVNYAAVALGLGVLTAQEGETVFWSTIITVIVSIVVHGVTATALSRRWLEGHKQPRDT